jgi:serine/threonine protein kinase
MPAHRISSFDFQPGQVVADKYRVLERIGKGWEGEIYLLRETSTRVERAGKFFFPHRNPRDQTARRYARKLHKLRDCPMITPYHTRERLEVEDLPVTLLVSEYVSGDTLSAFLRRQPGGRLTVFAALHLLHSLARGIETIHRHREYHGDLHAHNIMVKRFGLTFELRLLDLFNRGPFSARRVQDDICDMVRIFYDALGGAAHYPRLPAPAKDICRGLKRTLILERFRSAAQLARYIEQLSL